jgi:hypothetical protein
VWIVRTRAPILLADTADCELAPFVERRDATVTVENAASRAFARVFYDNATWAPICEYMMKNPLAFDPLTRTQLLNDALIFMKYACADS